ncbi:hypothetical protein LPTSP2_38530 [Leptospira ellinghausenii]|uniref:Uncharacterized protein n=1 Tax=Leptospira ellinghausenii TaxID=1917822 RepID=A0A2P2DJ09_9LEPT|nr:hypothetical protein LPTSP2_38530 [Leptospira ellinghausenii]
MVTERLNNLVIRSHRDISNDFLNSQIKKFNTYYLSDPWVKTELLILDKLNLNQFYIDPRKVKEDISFSRFKKIQERMNHYKETSKNDRTWKKVFRNFRIKFNKLGVEEAISSAMYYRLADLVQDLNLKWRYAYGIPYILSKKACLPNGYLKLR